MMIYFSYVFVYVFTSLKNRKEGFVGWHSKSKKKMKYFGLWSGQTENTTPRDPVWAKNNIRIRNKTA